MVWEGLGQKEVTQYSYCNLFLPRKSLKIHSGLESAVGQREDWGKLKGKIESLRGQHLVLEKGKDEATKQGKKKIHLHRRVDSGAVQSTPDPSYYSFQKWKKSPVKTLNFTEADLQENDHR